MPHSKGYQLVKLASGVHSVHSLAERETFHPVIGPVAEAEALYVRQLRLAERVQAQQGEFIVWDVGLGAAANVLTVLRATRDLAEAIRIVSFDHTLGPLTFALGHAAELGYFTGYESPLATLAREHHVRFQDGRQTVTWDFHLGDFPAYLRHALELPRVNDGSAQRFEASVSRPPAPHAILFDAFSPAKNPAMWTQPLFAQLFRMLDPTRACALPTYSRSTMLRVSLLLAGFYVGAGHATGEKEETTIAANSQGLITEPLDHRWLLRARRSTSAEPLWEPVYRQARLSDETYEKLQQHPQFLRR